MFSQQKYFLKLKKWKTILQVESALKESFVLLVEEFLACCWIPTLKVIASHPLLTLNEVGERHIGLIIEPLQGVFVQHSRHTCHIDHGVCVVCMDHPSKVSVLVLV